MKKKTIGIIGGMGPLATADLFTKIIEYTDASSDNEHIHIIIDNDPSVPNRTEAILNNTDTPVPYIVSTAKRLEKAGSDFLIMPCNTSHSFYDKICASLEVPLVNMVEETASYLRDNGVKKACLFATEGAVYSGVYDKACEKFGVSLCHPSDDVKKEVMRIIYDGVKAGSETWDVSFINGAIKDLESSGVGNIILGCTELPIAVRKYGIVGHFTDPTDILAKKAIEYAGYKVKK